ncbi:hypothetical protein [Sporichthya sp.]|uniref:hypothetical protein n=1 Tax=Sporichthya sp. TaxID=65475 RepID=UPI00182B557B|nr:hypothetical protein [Sporichthya sp.]MBA3741989.1 hypothetical protein [Sporichthya sp.]
MPQKLRSIHPDDAQDERLAALPLESAYTYAYLPTVLDDEGRAKDQPAVLNGYLWPLRADDHPTEAMDADLATLNNAGLICRYEVTGRPYLHDPRWKTRHKLTRPTPSTLPPCAVHEKSFDEAVTETFGKFAEQVNSAVGVAASHIDQKRIQDSLARLVEDVTYLVDPEKAVANGQKVRNMFSRSKSGEDQLTESAAEPGESDE